MKGMIWRKYKLKTMTVVEQLFEKLWNEPKDKLTWYHLLKLAKEMEKEQIIKAYNKSFENRYLPYHTAEQYYNDTYIKK
jgi:hypothetical protein